MERRSYLKAAGAVGLGSVALLAGCLGSNRRRFPWSSVDQEWLPAPATLYEDEDGDENYQVLSTAPATVDQYAAELTDQTWEAYQGTWLDWETANPVAEEVERITVGSHDDFSFDVAEHDIDDDVLVENLGDLGYEAAGSYEEFDLFEGPEEDLARAVGEGVLLSASGTDPLGMLETLVDSAAGDVDRYEQVNDDVATVVGETDTRYNYSLFPYAQEQTGNVPQQGVFAGAVAHGQNAILGEDSLEGVRVEVFSVEEDAQAADFETYVEANPLFDGADEVDIQTEGTVARIEYTVEYDVVTQDQLL